MPGLPLGLPEDAVAEAPLRTRPRQRLVLEIRGEEGRKKSRSKEEIR